MFFRHFISPGFVLEVNVLLIAVCIILMVDLYNHWKVKNSTLRNLSEHFYLIGMSKRVFWLRGLSLVAYLITAIVGIRMVIAPSRYKYATYMVMSTMVFITVFAIGISRYSSSKDGQFYANMMLEILWTNRHIEQIEYQLDCCGKNGPIDYEIANRTWEPATCCVSPDCPGCQQRFYAYLRGFEMEIARDNIISFIFLGIGMVLMFAHYHSMMLDNEIMQQDEEDEEEMLEQLLELKRERKKSAELKRESKTQTDQK